MAGGAALLFQSKHVAHTALFAQAINLVAWPALETAAATTHATYINLTAAAASLPEDDLAEAAQLLEDARSKLASIRRELAVATAQWRNGTLDQASFAAISQETKVAAADLAAKVASADATLSFLSAAAAAIDPDELYATLSTPLAAIASALALSTSAPAAAVLHGCPLGADAFRVFVQQASKLVSYVAPPDLSTGLEDALTPLSPQRRRWVRSALDAAAAFAGYTIARRAKAAAATLSAAALGASALVSAARGAGGDSLLLSALTAANDNLPADLKLPAPVVADGDGDEEAHAWCDAAWQQIRLLLVAWGVCMRAHAHNAHDSRSPPRALRTQTSAEPPGEVFFAHHLCSWSRPGPAATACLPSHLGSSPSGAVPAHLGRPAPAARAAAHLAVAPPRRLVGCPQRRQRGERRDAVHPAACHQRVGPGACQERVGQPGDGRLGRPPTCGEGGCL